jgi:ubiquinone/menaquinone biosynthesis C-methylase UbiE
VSFDRVARIYRWLETFVFGNQLQQARLAFPGEIDSPGRVLVVGEGDGRFLAEFVRLHPHSTVDCIEASGAMLRLAQARAEFPGVNFIHQDANESVLERESYDLIVTHFVLDCFNERTLSRLIEKLCHAAAPSSRWLIADFCEPPTGWRRWWARFLIAIMYQFFRCVAGIEATRLVDFAPFLRLGGFTLRKQVFSPNEMIRSQLWARCA